MTALVTGAAGFLGSAVVRAVLARGHTVRAFVRPGSDRRNLDGLDVEVVEGDLRAPETLAPAMRGVATAYLVAADYRLWTPDRAAMMAANVAGARAAARAAAEAGANRIIHTSSVATICAPKRGGAPSDETTPTAEADMVGPYKQSKYLGEIGVLEDARATGAPVIVVNPSTPIGPRDLKPTPTGKTILSCARGKTPAFVDSGLNVAHVDDVAEGHLLAAEKGAIGERYILGGENMQLAQVFALTAEAAGRRPPRVKLPHDLLWPAALFGELSAAITRREPMLTLDTLRMSKKHMFYSSDKARSALGYAARPGADAIRDAVAWYRVHGYCT